MRWDCQNLFVFVGISNYREVRFAVPRVPEVFSRCSAEGTRGEKEKKLRGRTLLSFTRAAKPREKPQAFRAGHFEDLKPETAHEKPLAPRVL